MRAQRKIYTSDPNRLSWPVNGLSEGEAAKSLTTAKFRPKRHKASPKSLSFLLTAITVCTPSPSKLMPCEGSTAETCSILDRATMVLPLLSSKKITRNMRRGTACASKHRIQPTVEEGAQEQSQDCVLGGTSAGQRINSSCELLMTRTAACVTLPHRIDSDFGVHRMGQRGNMLPDDCNKRLILPSASTGNEAPARTSK